ncbi:MAG: Flg hook protein, partial [Bacteroidota bacterium]|nr:Flg hook protein [Bacteroidota bacterium]
VIPQSTGDNKNSQILNPVKETINPQSTGDTKKSQILNPVQEAVTSQSTGDTKNSQIINPVKNTITTQSTEESKNSQIINPVKNTITTQSTEESKNSQIINPVKNTITTQSTGDSKNSQMTNPVQDIFASQSTVDTKNSQILNPVKDNIVQENTIINPVKQDNTIKNVSNSDDTLKQISNDKSGITEISGKTNEEEIKLSDKLVEKSANQSSTGNSKSGNNSGSSLPNFTKDASVELKNDSETMKNSINILNYNNLESEIKTENKKSEQIFESKIYPQEFTANTLQILKNLPDNSSASARLILKPETLGTIFVEISIVDKNIKLNIKADSQEAARSIESQIGLLKDKLAGEGLKIESIDIEERQVDEDLANNKNNNGSGSDAREDKKTRSEFVKSFSNIDGSIDASLNEISMDA